MLLAFRRRFRRPRFLAAAAWLAVSVLALASCSHRTIPASSLSPQATSGIAVAPPAPLAPEAGLRGPAGPEGLPPAGAGTVRVALLLPLSGSSGALGRAMLDAAQMALFEVGDERLQLLPRDTRGTPQTAAAAATAALAAGARLIIGPLLAGEVAAVKPVAQAANVPMLAFSTATQLAGDGTYLMGFLPRQEIERVAAFAHSRGLGRFAVLAPRNPYGEVAAEAMRGAVQREGAALTQVEYYEPRVASQGPAIRRLAAAAAGFDALLLPEGGAALKSLAPLLPYYNIDPDKVKLLGTGLWDEPGIGTEPALQGGWYAAPAPQARLDFDKRFQDLYGRPPPRLATLAYDATALAAVLAHGPNGADFSPAALTNPSGFSGIDGIFRLRPDGLAQRGLAVLEVRRRGSAVIDPAPETFQQLGF